MVPFQEMFEVVGRSKYMALEKKYSASESLMKMERNPAFLQSLYVIFFYL